LPVLEVLLQHQRAHVRVQVEHARAVDVLHEIAVNQWGERPVFQHQNGVEAVPVSVEEELGDLPGQIAVAKGQHVRLAARPAEKEGEKMSR